MDTDSNRKIFDLALVLNEVKNFCLNSTIHGIPSFARTDKIVLKILWFIATLVSSTFCAYVILKSVQEYFQYNVVSQISSITEIPTYFRKYINFF